MPWYAGLTAVRLAARFLVPTVAGRLIALTVALCAVLSFLELPGAWWLLLPLAVVAVLACASGLAFSGHRAPAAGEPAGLPELGPRLTDA